MKVRPFEPGDIQACARVFMEAYNRMPWNYGWKEADAIRYLSEYASFGPFVGLVLCEGEEIAAACFAHRKTWWTGDQLFIDELFVSAESQGLGYGKVLMKKAEEYCREHKLDMITLMTNKLMPALKFYESIDYTRVDQYVFLFKQI
jgi:aminoglycoside 6'-N-acetyltransferase I